MGFHFRNLAIDSPGNYIHALMLIYSYNVHITIENNSRMYRLSNRQSVVMEIQERRDVVETFLYFQTARGPI